MSVDTFMKETLDETNISLDIEKTLLLQVELDKWKNIIESFDSSTISLQRHNHIIHNMKEQWATFTFYRETKENISNSKN